MLYNVRWYFHYKKEELVLAAIPFSNRYAWVLGLSRAYLCEVEQKRYLRYPLVILVFRGMNVIEI